jgi:hypothetical protein
MSVNGPLFKIVRNPEPATYNDSINFHQIEKERIFFNSLKKLNSGNIEEFSPSKGVYFGWLDTRREKMGITVQPFGNTSTLIIYVITLFFYLPFLHSIVSFGSSLEFSYRDRSEKINLSFQVVKIGFYSILEVYHNYILAHLFLVLPSVKFVSPPLF